MGLRKYFAKRRFKDTPEPKGRVHKQHKSLAFVVQEHHASRLHYDFRLELDGVLKSWAIPKGPSMDPHEHHLAVHVEDHPYEYRKFEGVIPKGNYGAGNVIIWDEGTYEPRADSDDPEKTLREAYKKGHITFVMHGTKLHGEFALIKMQGKDDDAWLLVKKGDEFATKEDITAQNTSVKSGVRVDDIAGGIKLPDLSTYPKKAQPWHVRPMLCTLVEESFDNADWLFEVKWDGYRAVASKKHDHLLLYSRMGTDFAEKFAPVTEALRTLTHDVILDGEVVVVDNEGSPHFEWLQDWHRNPQGHLQYMVFDILWCDGFDICSMPLRERKQLLKKIIPDKSLIRYSDHVEAKGVALFEQMQHRGLEGIVAKRADSTYHENDRGQSWLKIKTHLRQEVVIGGFTEPRGTRKHLGALIVGVYDHGELQYVGHSGGGIPDDIRRKLRAKLDRLERKSSPFAVEPKPNAPVHWVRPELVCEMNFSEWTKEGSMRQPKFVGMREDKKAVSVHREKAKNTAKPAKSPAAQSAPDGARDLPAYIPKAARHIAFSHLDKVFFPRHKYTKGDLLEYYSRVAPIMLPYLKDRPHSLLRQPGGQTDHGFFQKNMEHLPDWVPATDIYSESNKGTLHWIVGGDVATLLYMVQLGTIEINPWNSRVGQLDKPDWAVIDLDPEGVTFEDVITVARTVHDVCKEWGVTAIPKTSGKTGIHIFIPMGGKYRYEIVRDFAHLIGMEVNKRQPKLTSLERMPEKRRHRIYLDYLQNREGQTLAAPYSVRPTLDASVSTPLHWEEVKSGLKPSDFTIANMAARLDTVGDIWKPVLGKPVDIAAVLKRVKPATER